MKLPSLPEGEITAIEVHRANPYVELGISVVGGNETPLINIVIQEVYRDGVIARDGRLLAGDQILQVRGPPVMFSCGSCVLGNPFLNMGDFLLLLKPFKAAIIKVFIMVMDNMTDYM